jgi:hypothetical protein
MPDKINPIPPTLQGLHNNQTASPGCAARPWAGLCNRFAVKRRPVPRVRCATLGWVVQPLRGKYGTNPPPPPGCAARPWAGLCNRFAVKKAKTLSVSNNSSVAPAQDTGASASLRPATRRRPGGSLQGGRYSLRADPAPGRGRAGECRAWRQRLTGRFVSRVRDQGSGPEARNPEAVNSRQRAAATGSMPALSPLFQ